MTVNNGKDLMRAHENGQDVVCRRKLNSRDSYR